MCGSFAIIASLTPMVTPVMDILYPLNESRIKDHLFSMERFVDEQEHFYKIYFHSVFTIVLANITIVAIACLFENLTQQLIGVFNILR